MTMDQTADQLLAVTRPWPPPLLPSGEAQALGEIALALERIADELHQLHITHEKATLDGIEELTDLGVDRLRLLTRTVHGHAP